MELIKGKTALVLLISTWMDSMILATNNLQPDIEKLDSNIQPQKSHYIESMFK